MLSFRDTAIAAQKVSPEFEQFRFSVPLVLPNTLLLYMTKRWISDRERKAVWWPHWPEILCRIRKLKCMKFACMLRIQVLHAVQCNLRKLKGSSNVQITKHAGSVSCSECLPLVTDITFINIMVLGPELGLCPSKCHTIFLCISHLEYFNEKRVFFSSHQIHHLNFPTNVSQFPHSLPFPPSIQCP